jgi:hypothetical protein
VIEELRSQGCPEGSVTTGRGDIRCEVEPQKPDSAKDIIERKNKEKDSLTSLLLPPINLLPGPPLIKKTKSKEPGNWGPCRFAQGRSRNQPRAKRQLASTSQE